MGQDRSPGDPAGCPPASPPSLLRLQFPGLVPRATRVVPREVPLLAVLVLRAPQAGVSSPGPARSMNRPHRPRTSPPQPPNADIRSPRPSFDPLQNRLRDNHPSTHQPESNPADTATKPSRAENSVVRKTSRQTHDRFLLSLGTVPSANRIGWPLPLQFVSPHDWPGTETDGHRPHQAQPGGLSPPFQPRNEIGRAICRLRGGRPGGRLHPADKPAPGPGSAGSGRPVRLPSRRQSPLPAAHSPTALHSPGSSPQTP